MNHPKKKKPKKPKKKAPDPKALGKDDKKPKPTPAPPAPTKEAVRYELSEADHEDFARLNVLMGDAREEAKKLQDLAADVEAKFSSIMRNRTRLFTAVLTEAGAKITDPEAYNIATTEEGTRSSLVLKEPAPPKS